MSDTVTVSKAPDPIWYKAQRVIRSVIVAAVVLIPVANATLPALAAAFDEPGVPPKLVLIVNGAVAGSLVVVGVITRLIAIPAVNALLTRIGAGSVPKSAVTATVPAAAIDAGLTALANAPAAAGVDSAPAHAASTDTPAVPSEPTPTEPIVLETSTPAEARDMVPDPFTRTADDSVPPIPPLPAPSTQVVTSS